MNDTTLYTSRLEAEKAKLETELESVARPNPATPNDWEATTTEEGEADPNVQADKLEHFQENVAILEDLEARYADVQAALARIADGTYGKCEVCGKEIESARLEANPAARTCEAHLS